jgi:hypothetical protein
MRKSERGREVESGRKKERERERERVGESMTTEFKVLHILQQ